jgi:hypothetical protein
MNLATGKLPQATLVYMLRPFGYQKFSVVILNHTNRDMNYFFIH